MEKVSELKILEFRYDSKEEREQHVGWMESQGFECNGQVKKSNGSLWNKKRESYWYGHFSKQY